MKTELTIEESTKLIELGIDPKLASGWEYEARIELFTLSDILSILPKEIDDYCLSIDATNVYYSVAYAEWDEDVAVLRHLLFEVIDSELIDALYQNLIWCIKSGYYNLKNIEK